MNILIVSATVNTIGGIQNYNKKLVKEFEKQGHSVHRHELSHRGLIAKILFSLYYFIVSAISRPDITLCMHINFSPLPYLANCLLKRPYALVIYGTEVEPIKRKMYKRAVASAHTVVKLFDAAEKSILRQIPKVADRIVRIPNSIDAGAFYIKTDLQSVTQRYNLAGKKIIFTIARIARADGENKGFMRVIEALPRVIKEIPNAVYILGGGGDNHDMVKARARALGVENRLIMPGRIANKDLNDFYSVADVFVTPSKNEGFPPIVFLESLASGTPIIGGYQPHTEADDKLWQNELGIIVDPDDIDAIATAIVQILSGEAPKHLYDSAYLRKTILEHYGRDKYARHVKEFVQRFESDI